MIGMAYVSVVKYFNSAEHKMAFKKRPVLIIGKADDTDYVVLPISRVTKRQYLHEHYDYEISPNDVPLMNLKQTSYIRTHKQLTVSKAELTYGIVDFRHEYPNFFKKVIDLVEEFQTTMLNKAR